MDHLTFAFCVRFTTGLLPSPSSSRHSRLLLRNSIQVCCGGSFCMPREQSSQGPHCPQPTGRNGHNSYVDLQVDASRNYNVITTWTIWAENVITSSVRCSVSVLLIPLHVSPGQLLNQLTFGFVVFNSTFGYVVFYDISRDVSLKHHINVFIGIADICATN